MWKTYRTEPRQGRVLNHQVQRFLSWGCRVRIVDVKTGNTVRRPFLVTNEQKCRDLVAAAREWAR